MMRVGGVYSAVPLDQCLKGSRNKLEYRVIIYDSHSKFMTGVPPVQLAVRFVLLATQQEKSIRIEQQVWRKAFHYGFYRQW